MKYVPGLITPVWKFIHNRDKGTDKGADATFHTEIVEDRRLILDQTNDLLRALFDTGSATRAFGNNDMWYHRLLLLFVMGDS
jgi:hypothetical protein